MNMENIMGENVKKKKTGMKRTDLAWDNYMDYLIEEIRQSKFMKRAKDKPMFAASHEQEPHRTTRLEHSEMAANIARKIAKSLGLNYEYIYTAMLGHDGGHPFSAHDGEEMFNGEAILNNCQYFHHNAEGIKVIEAEHILEKAIARIPNIDSMPKLRQKLVDEFPYFLDVVISHDGEATPGEMYKKPIEYPDIKTAVETKLRLATAKNGNYKFTAQTPEGQIAKFADVIAYLATDIQDRFRSGLHKDFPDEYLIMLAPILAKNYISGGEEEAIEVAEKNIKDIEKQYIQQHVYATEKNENIIAKAEKLAEEILNQDIDFGNIDDVNLAIEEALGSYNELLSKVSGEEKKTINSEKLKIKRCIGNFIHARSGVIKEVTDKMQTYFIDDLLKNSENSDYLHFSDSVEQLFFKAKNLNYKFLPQAKWHYLDEGQPEAVHGLVEFLSMSLRRTGVIENFFYDESIREQLKENPEALKYMRTESELQYLKPNNEKYEEYKKAFGIEDVRISNKKYAGGDKERLQALKELFAAAYTYAQDTENTFVQQYLNTFYAIEDQVTCKVDNILGLLNTKNKKARKTHIKFYDKMIEEDEQNLKQYIEKEYGPITEITDEMRKKIIEDITYFQRMAIEDKMAKQIAITYLSGKTDKSFIKLAKDTGFMEADKNVFNEETRGCSSEKLDALGNAMLQQLEKKEKNEDEGR